MIRDWVAGAASAGWGIVALLLFLAVFIGVLVWVFRPGSRQKYERAARLPLERDGERERDDEPPGGRAGRAQEGEDGERAG